MLRNRFPQLQDLQIHFRSTIEVSNGHDFTNGWYYDDRTRLYCQDKLIDWFMTYVFRHINHIKKVTLTGYVKSPRKQQWNKAFHDHYTHGTMPPILESEFTIVMQAQARYPPKCLCKFPCILPRQGEGLSVQDSEIREDES